MKSLNLIEIEACKDNSIIIKNENERIINLTNKVDYLNRIINDNVFFCNRSQGYSSALCDVEKVIDDALVELTFNIGDVL